MKIQITIAIIMMMGMVSALDVSPKSFQINAYPCQVIYKNLTFSSSIDNTIFLYSNVLTPTGINLNYSINFSMNAGKINKTISFNIPCDEQTGIYKFEIESNALNQEPMAFSYIGGYKSKQYSINVSKSNEIKKEPPINYVKKDSVSNTKSVHTEDNPKKIEEKKGYLSFIILGIIFFIAIIVIALQLSQSTKLQGETPKE